MHFQPILLSEPFLKLILLLALIQYHFLLESPIFLFHLSLLDDGNKEKIFVGTAWSGNSSFQFTNDQSKTKRFTIRKALRGITKQRIFYS